MTVDRVSYSTLSDWQYCTNYFKLSHIDGLKPYESTVWTAYGGLVHKYVQNVLQDIIDVEYAQTRFVRTWDKFCGMYRKDIAKQLKPDVDPKTFSIAGFNILKDIKSAMKKQFGNYKILHIEERLELPSGDKWPQKFKGFIDIVIELENGSIILADFKSCKSGYLFNKYRDKYKDYQLTLYKHFLAIKYGIDPDKIETWFILLERNHKSKTPIQFVRVTSGKKKVKNAVAWLNKALNSINKNIWIKNRMNCRKFCGSNPYEDDHACKFLGTEYCK